MRKYLTVTKLLHMVLNSSLFLLAIALIYLLGKEGFHLLQLALFGGTSDTHTALLVGILTFFLYFEFLSMILKYYQEDYHFPLRYFMYVGITATVRLIVVDHKDGSQTLYFAGTILLLVISYAIITLLSLEKEKRNSKV